MGDVAGATTIEFRRINDDITLNNVQSLSTVLKQSNVSTVADVVVNYDAATVVGESDTASVTVDTSTGGGDFTVNGVETLAVTAVGADNDVNFDGDALETITVAGSGDINFDIDASVTTVNASSNTGGVTVNTTAAADVSLTGGSGNDTFNLGTRLTADDTLNGGNGTDTLSITAFATVAGETYSSTNIEVLELASAAVTVEVDQFSNAENFTGVTVLADANALVLNDVNATTQVTLTNSTARADDAQTSLTITTDSDTGTEDTYTVNLVANGTDVEAGNGDLFVGTLSVDEIENVTLNVTGTNAAVDAMTLNEIDDLTVTGSATLVLGGDFDAAGTAITIDEIHADNFTGDMTVWLGAAAHAVTTGSGDDTIQAGANLGTTDTINGGTGDDILVATPAAGVAAATISNIETIELDFETAAATVSMSNVTGANTLNLSGDEAHRVSGLDASISTINLASVDADGGETVTLTYDANVTSAVNLVIGDVVDGTVNADVDVDAVNVATYAGALTLTSDGVVALNENSINGFDANTATSLTVITEEDLLITGGGDDDISATSATTVTLTSAGGVLTVDDDLLVDDASNITIDAADGNITITGDVFSDANAAAATTDEVTDVTLRATSNANLIIDGVLDVEYARNIAMTANNRGDIRVDGMDIAGTDGDGDNIAVAFTLTTDDSDSTINFNTGVASGAAVVDLITVVSGAGATANVTEVTITNADTDVTITEIDATQAAGDLVINLTTSNDAVEITTGSGDATITTTTAADTIVLGSGDNTVITQDGADDITLGTGSDDINLSTDDDTIIVRNFDLDNDVLSIDLSAFGTVMNGNSTAVETFFNAVVQEIETGGAVVDVAAGTNVVLLTTLYANEAAMLAAVEADVGMAGVDAAGDDLIVIWSDGADSFLSTVNIDAVADGDGSVSVDASSTSAQIVGVADVTDLTAANFAFVA